MRTFYIKKIFPLISVFSLAFVIYMSGFLSAAFAQSPSIASAQTLSQRELLKLILTGCFSMSLFICFLGFLGVHFYSKDKDKVNFAEDIIKLLLGFFIGLITGFLDK